MAQTWSALRKSWLGFKIAKRNGDRLLMKYYAEFIVKLQIELGISVTQFDPGLVENQNGDSTAIDEQPDTVQQGYNINEKDFEFEVALPTVQTSHTAPGPRKEIFTKYLDRKQKSCASTLTGESNRKKAKVIRRSINLEHSCPTSSAQENKPDLAIRLHSGVFYPDRSELCCFTDINSQDSAKLPFWERYNSGDNNRKTDFLDSFTPNGLKEEEEGQHNMIQINNDFGAEQPSDNSWPSTQYNEYDPNRITKRNSQRKKKKNRHNNSSYYKRVDEKACYYKSDDKGSCYYKA